MKAALLHWSEEEVQAHLAQELSFVVIVLPTSNTESICDFSGYCLLQNEYMALGNKCCAQAWLHSLFWDQLLSVGEQITL